MGRSHHVALIGANSAIGGSILSSLAHSPSITRITVMVRSSSAPLPHYPRTHPVVLPSDVPSVAELAHLLRHVDTLVCGFSPPDPAGLELQLRLADACVAAGVGRYVAGDWGSVRSDDAYVLDLFPRFANKRRVREHCIRLAEDYGAAFTWTSVATGHFFDWGLDTELLGFDVGKRTALLFDEGGDKFSTTNLAQIGRAVVAILDRLEQTANQYLSVHSFCVSQAQVLEAIEATLGGPKFTRDRVGSRAFVRENMPNVNTDKRAMELVIGVLGIKRSNWTGSPLFANDLLGLKDEDMEETVRRVLKK